MRTVLYGFALVFVSACFFEAEDRPRISAMEFARAQVRDDLSCAGAWDAISIIERLGDFDGRRFGANSVLEQIIRLGCTEDGVDILIADAYGTQVDEFYRIGPSRSAVKRRAERVLSEPMEDTAVISTPVATSECAPVSITHPDDLGMLLFFHVEVEDDRPSDLFEAFSKKMICGEAFDRIWAQAFEDLDRAEVKSAI